MTDAAQLKALIEKEKPDVIVPEIEALATDALVEVEAFTRALGPERWQALAKASAERYPLGRIATPEDVAKAALFLASDDAAMITGSCVEVDGGRCI